MDESFGPVLKFIRIVHPPAGKLDVYVFVAAIAVLLIVLLYSQYKKRIKSALHYLEAIERLQKEAEEKGLSDDEIEALKILARRHYVKNPLSLIISQLSYEKAIDRLVHAQNSHFSSDEILKYYSLFNAIRKKLFLILPGADFYLISSRQIPAGKTVWIKKKGLSDSSYQGFIVQSSQYDGLHVKSGNDQIQQQSFSPGNAVEVMFHQNNPARYIFQTRILTADNNDAGAYVIDHVPEMKLYQEKVPFNIVSHTVFEYCVVPHTSVKEAEDYDNSDFKKFIIKHAVLHDVSPNGITFTSLPRVVVDDLILIRIKIKDRENFMFIKAVVRSVQRESSDLPFLVQAEFTEITDSQLDELLHYFNIEKHEENG